MHQTPQPSKSDGLKEHNPPTPQRQALITAKFTLFVPLFPETAALDPPSKPDLTIKQRSKIRRGGKIREPPRPVRAGIFHRQSVVTVSAIARGRPTLTTPPGALGFAVSGVRKQISEPRRLAAASSPSRNGEGSTRVYRRADFEPAESTSESGPRPVLPKRET